MVKVLVIIVLVIALSVAGVLIWGAFLPSTVSATRSAVLRASVDTVFARVADPAGQTTWRTDVSAVTMEPGGTAWTETTRGGIVIRFEEVTREAPARYAIRFASPQGFDGAWEGVFAAEGENTRVTFTETVTNPSLIGRILARLFAPPGAHIDRYLADLTVAVEKS